MENKNMEIWDRLKTPPEDALKTITGGRLKGMSDINPQWRYESITGVFGPCGIGWKHTIDKLWTEVVGQEILAFALVSFYYKNCDVWSEPLHGIGGSKLLTMEKAGLVSNDEGYKMAVTDALSVALKMIGVAADIYRGHHDTKYSLPDSTSQKTPYSNYNKVNEMFTDKKNFDSPGDTRPVTEAQVRLLGARCASKKIDRDIVTAHLIKGFAKDRKEDLNRDEFQKMLSWVDNYQAQETVNWVEEKEVKTGGIQTWDND
jgi:hypothetical protein